MVRIVVRPDATNKLGSSSILRPGTTTVCVLAGVPTAIAAIPPEIRALVPLPNEARVSQALRGDPRQSVRAIAAQLGIPKSGVHLALGRLIEIGLLQREHVAPGYATTYRVSGTLRRQR